MKADGNKFDNIMIDNIASRYFKGEPGPVFMADASFRFLNGRIFICKQNLEAVH